MAWLPSNFRKQAQSSFECVQARTSSRWLVSHWMFDQTVDKVSLFIILPTSWMLCTLLQWERIRLSLNPLIRIYEQRIIASSPVTPFIHPLCSLQKVFWNLKPVGFEGTWWRLVAVSSYFYIRQRGKKQSPKSRGLAPSWAPCSAALASTTIGAGGGGGGGRRRGTGECNPRPSPWKLKRDVEENVPESGVLFFRCNMCFWQGSTSGLFKTPGRLSGTYPTPTVLVLAADQAILVFFRGIP